MPLKQEHSQKYPTGCQKTTYCDGPCCVHIRAIRCIHTPIHTSKQSGSSSSTNPIHKPDHPKSTLNDGIAEPSPCQSLRGKLPRDRYSSPKRVITIYGHTYHIYIWTYNPRFYSLVGTAHRRGIIEEGIGGIPCAGRAGLRGDKEIRR